MKPTIGRIVVLKGLKQDGTKEAPDGTKETPAIVNCVGKKVENSMPEEWSVNLTAFPDNAAPKPLTDVCLFQTKVAAEDYRAKNTSDDPCYAAYWPEHAP